MAKARIRWVEVREVRYLRVDDVVAFIRELAGGEETDVRRRIEAGAAAVHKASQSWGSDE